MSSNTKKILIETESHEIVSLRIFAPEIPRIYCESCEKIEEMLDVNAAVDVSGTAARDLLQRVESGELHSPNVANGHLLICRYSLEQVSAFRENQRNLTPDSEREGACLSLTPCDLR